MDKQTKVKQASSENSDKVQFVAKARYIRYSPYKLRPIADVIRGKDVVYALNWLTTYRTQRVEPIKKVLESAVANAKNLQNVETSALAIKEIRIDQGPIHRYFKPGAMGRAMVQRKRMSHLSVILEPKN
ncbi:50S ribosomal protein L22 [Candidatus Dependentiae bacterium]|nr:50S ribosomal protein L22 [Candidatus Dependentiae bacterium]